MLNYIFGRPGTGKTYEVIRRIRADLETGTAKVFLIVPEQQLFSTESMVLPGLPPAAGQRLSVLSFSRLADTAADCFGGRTFGKLTRASRTLLMWRTLRELSGLLSNDDDSPDGNASICRLMLSAVDELSRNAVSPIALERAARQLPQEAPLSRKLLDLSLVSSAYGGLLTELCGNDPADRLLRTATSLQQNDYFAGATVYLDSFTSFTAQEYAILDVMLAQAADVTVTLCLEGRKDNEPHLDSLRDTIRRIDRHCERLGVHTRETILTMVRRTSAPELSLLERELWHFGPVQDSCKTIPEEERGHIRLITASDIYEEAHAAALHIHELKGSGIPYGKMAVIVRDTATWRGVLDAALENDHIPFFLSDRVGLGDRPAVRLLLLALRCICRGYQTTDVVALCKTGLCGLSLDDLDAFSQYVDTWRISGKRMSDLSADWSMNPDGYTIQTSPRGHSILIAANRVRRVIIPPLLELETRLAVADSPEEQCRALFSYLSTLGVKDSLAEMAESLLAMGKTQEAGETVRLWSLLTGALVDIATLLPPEGGGLQPDELAAALELYFTETDMGAVPARQDCVTVGSASMLRLEDMEAVLVLGLCEGEFPRPVSDTGLLTELDKDSLEAFGIEFDDRSDRQTSEELLYIWRAMTKPSRALLLFTHTRTPDGSTVAPSLAYSRVQLLLPYLEPLHFSEAFLDTDGGSYQPVETESLPMPTIRETLGEELWLSHTALQTYARCPYSFFGSHILKLRAPVEAKLDELNAGLFLHHVLEMFLRQSLDEHHRLRPLSEAEIIQVADQIMQGYMTDLCGDIEGDGRLLHLFARLRNIALVLVRSIVAELEQGSFTVAGLEWDTHGRREGDPLPLEVPVAIPDDSQPNEYSSPLPSSQVLIRMGGVIDRVDIFRDGETVYVRVIDYKSSKHIFSEEKAWKEMNIQLLLYLFTLCSPRNRYLFADEDGVLPQAVLPAEVLYLSPSEQDDGSFLPYRSGAILDREEVLQAANADPGDLSFLPGVKRGKDGSLTGTALCTQEHMTRMEEAVRSVIREVGTALYTGRADRTAGREACRFCTMKGSCPFAVQDRSY